jgi:predicted DNA-binding transcriptional regulator
MKILFSDDLSRIEKFADLFKTLGHPYKFIIFKYLCDCNCDKMRVKDIYTSLGIQQATASRHLNGLKNKGLLKRTLADGMVFFEPNIENELVNCMSHCIIGIK